jgi:TldD protein
MELQELRYSVELALEMAEAEAAVTAAEVCASWCERQTVRIHYDADHPSGGVQAPQTCTTFGIGILVVVEDQAGRRVGFGSEGRDLSPEGITLALEKAKANAVADADFAALPSPPMASSGSAALHDPQALVLQDDDLARLATEAVNGALSTFAEAGYVKALQIDGEVRSRKEHLVVGNTNGLLAGETSTGLLAAMHSRLSSEQSQGTGSSSATHVQDFAAYDAGLEAARQALQARGGMTPAAGDSVVVFGPRAVADLFQALLLPALSLDTVSAGTSPFANRLGQQVASPLLTVADEGRLPGLLGSRAITGEGLPTGTTTLLEQGRLTGFLADAYHARKLAGHVGVLPARNGMRLVTDGQSFAMRPGIFPTNVTVTSQQAETLEALLAPIPDGIYVGGLWYTCPQDGLHTGEFTSTVIGPSFRIRQGKLERPVQPGTLRLHDNVLDLLHRITGISTTRHAVALATMQSLVLAPEVRCSQARFVS